jgi:hypothetical protein
VPEDGTEVFKLTAEIALIKLVGMGRVAGYSVGMDVRSTFGYAAAQLKAKPQPVRLRKKIHPNINNINPTTTPNINLRKSSIFALSISAYGRN